MPSNQLGTVVTLLGHTVLMMMYSHQPTQGNSVHHIRYHSPKCYSILLHILGNM